MSLKKKLAQIVPFLLKPLRPLFWVASALALPLDISLKKEKRKIPAVQPVRKAGKKYKPPSPYQRVLSVGVNWAKTGFFIGIYYIVQPLSSFLFPKAEDILKNEGLDPKIVRTLTPRTNIRIVPDNLAGQAYFMLRYSPLLQPASFYATAQSVFSSTTRGFTETSPPRFTLLPVSEDMRMIYLKSNSKFLDQGNADFKEETEMLSDGKYTFVAPITSRHFALRALLHEIRHTNHDNISLPPLYCEADADYWAFISLAKGLKDPQLAQRMLWDDALSGSADTHNTTLYLQMKFNGEALPEESAMKQANNDAKPAISTFRKLSIYTLVDHQQKVDSLSSVYRRQMAKLSPLARKRVKIVEEAYHNTVRPVAAKKPAVQVFNSKRITQTPRS